MKIFYTYGMEFLIQSRIPLNFSFFVSFLYPPIFFIERKSNNEVSSDPSYASIGHKPIHIVEIKEKKKKQSN